MRKLLPVILALLGLGGGIGAGLALRPAPVEAVVLDPCGDLAGPETGTEGHEITDETDPDAEGGPAAEFVKLNNQFIVPVVNDETVSALVILSMSIEVTTGTTEKVYALEPKLRDQFLQVLFDHANSGGFDGNFTASGNMEILRNGLLEVARKLLGAAVKDVLIENIVRQDA